MAWYGKDDEPEGNTGYHEALCQTCWDKWQEEIKEEQP